MLMLAPVVSAVSSPPVVMPAVDCNQLQFADADDSASPVLCDQEYAELQWI
jgi:hypothetical protein